MFIPAVLMPKLKLCQMSKLKHIKVNPSEIESISDDDEQEELQHADPLHRPWR